MRSIAHGLITVGYVVLHHADFLYFLYVCEVNRLC